MNIRRVRLALGAAVLAVALAGCMKVDMQLDVHTDDTIDGSMIFAVNRSLTDVMGGTDAMLDDLLGDTTDLPEGSTSEPYEDGEFVGAKYTFTDAPLSTFDDGETEGLQIVHEGNEFILTGAVDLSETTTGDLEGLEGTFEGIMEGFDVRISVTFPGEVIEHNGDLDGTTVTWVPQPGDNVELSARAEDSGGAGGLPIWGWILIAAAIVAVLIGALFYFSRNRTKPDVATPAAGSYPPLPGAPDSYPPPPATDIASSTAETPLSSAAAGAEEAAEAMRARQHLTGTPLGAEESEADTRPARPPAPETPAADREPPPPPPPN